MCVCKVAFLILTIIKPNQSTLKYVQNTLSEYLISAVSNIQPKFNVYVNKCVHLINIRCDIIFNKW